MPRAVCRNYEDVYSDPGAPLSRRTSWGTHILAKLDGQRKLLMEPVLRATGPFLDVLDIDTGTSTRLWQSSAPHYEQPGSIFNDTDDSQPVALEGLQLTFTRESAQEPPQTFIKTFTQGGAQVQERRVTDFPHPYPALRGLQREVLRYPRPDGVMLTATLYTPPGYSPDRDGALPAIFWAYPREFKSKEAAGQMRRSPYQFASIGSLSPILWVARGYAVLDGPTLPIVAEGEAEPNDSFLEQLTGGWLAWGMQLPLLLRMKPQPLLLLPDGVPDAGGAKAAVEECVKRGVVDPARVSVGGHSYGAFMAANLVTHAPEVFAAGVARTGAFNRTLTPFGFQNEERTLWQVRQQQQQQKAPEVYSAMSPFMSAHKLQRPLLLIHGEEDNNPGTFPLQSERYFQARPPTCTHQPMHTTSSMNDLTDSPEHNTHGTCGCNKMQQLALALARLAALKGHGATCRLVLLPHESHGYRAYESTMHTLYEQDQWFERYAGFGRVDPNYGCEADTRQQAPSAQGPLSKL
ncbi:hypothetical protein QJQ45_011313 [Haematococcus lacustris]|nr:hypothetical protein QJQ45_011313 [Haematococcus lacustris]